jgi:hypothetical protein
MDLAERALLVKTVDDALSRATGTNGDADAALAELGWLDMLAAEPDVAIDIVFSALGRHNLMSSALDDVLAPEPRPDLAVLLPPFGAWELRGAGLATARIATASDVLVGTDIVPVADVTVTPIRGLDPTAGLFGVDSSSNRAPIDTKSLAAAQVAVAFQLAGASRAMLDLACAHALEREQFGRAVASFQAVRHRLAEALVAVEAAEASAQAALEDGGPVTAALAKAVAGRSARVVAKHAQQVLAGIGFTTEHAFHRYLKRTMVLDGLFGSTDALVVDLGHQLLANRAVPTLIEL